MFEYNAEVRRVVDGDTIDLLVDLGFSVHIAERVRLLGVDTPEVYGTRKKDPEQYKRGKAASAFAKAWLDEAKGKVRIRTSKGKGKYGRWLAEVFRDGDERSLNQALLDEGHAVVPSYS